MRNRVFSVLSVVMMGLALMGCQNLKAPGAYKAANQSRLNAVEPMLQTYATDHPADAQKVSDLTRSWHVEVAAQQSNP